jgi:PPOX class probable F420-dependent enzyme
MALEWSPEQREFLDDHQWAVLATGRKDGSPQQSMTGYLVDDEGRLVMSVKSYTAKWHNAVRQPLVSVAVPDGRTHLVIYGEAETIDTDPLRARLTAEVFGKLMDVAPADPATLIPELDAQRRTVLRITPTKTVFLA